MEGKTILLCLMVLVLLGNLSHARNCHTHRAFWEPFICFPMTCQATCEQKWRNLLDHSYCHADNIFVNSCMCVVCDK
ncbi:hypothetical protein ZWY2020_025942 [Hordeum vulgare]|nr:hypothetical protein ZWY2020_025942 [Hordeum vulgare]